MASLVELYDCHEDAILDYCRDWNIDSTDLVEAREAEDEAGIAWAAHYIWEALPDRPAIRHGGFFQICDLAEHIFDEDKPKPEKYR